MGNKLKAAALAVLLLVATVIPSVGAVPTTTMESQAWWNRAGIVIPTAVGAHIHLKATVPQDGALVDGTIEVPYTVTLHEARGKTNWIRMGTESKELFNKSFVLGPCTDCSVSGVASLNVGQLSTGRHELRMSVNNPDEDPTLSGSQRMFQSTGYQFCVRSCTPTYRSGFQSIARGWYAEGHDYANAQLESAASAVKPGASVRVRMTPGSGGNATKEHGVFIDPDFHNGSAGTVVKQGAGPFTGNVVIPALPAGPHKLVLVSSDGQNAGVFVLFFVVE